MDLSVKSNRFRSLRIDLIVDLSLLTLCALLLSEALMIVMLRRDLPKELEATAQRLLFQSEIQLTQSPEFAKTSYEMLPELFQKLSRETSESRLNLSLLIEPLPEDIQKQGALRAGEVSSISRSFFKFIPYTSDYFLVGSASDGRVIVYRWSLSSFQEMLTGFKFRIFLITLFIEALLVFLAYQLLFRRNILHPIQELSAVSKEFLNENWKARCNFERQDELGSVGEVLNEMAQKIEDKERKLVLTIESLKAANEELEVKQNEQLQIEKLASIGRLAAGVAHEVGNPLGAISGYVDILRRSLQKMPSANKEDVDLCDRIEQETNRISKIIRALLQQARPPKERIRSVQLKNVLVRCVSLAQIPSSIDVSYDFEDDQAQVSAEEDQLVQVFLNILVNAKHAIEARRDRKEEGRLVVRCRLRKLPLYRTQATEGGGSDFDTSVVRALKPEVYWVVGIEDNGVGISEEDQKKLFEPFFSTKAPGKGTGLGLYVTKSIVESFRGAIVVRSAPGFGASFSVFLPIAKASDSLLG